MRRQYLGKGLHLATRLNGSGYSTGCIDLVVTVHLNDAPHSFLLAFLQGPELIGINKVCVLDTETVEFIFDLVLVLVKDCLLYTSPSPRDYAASRMPSSA